MSDIDRERDENSLFTGEMLSWMLNAGGLRNEFYLNSNLAWEQNQTDEDGLLDQP